MSLRSSAIASSSLIWHAHTYKVGYSLNFSLITFSFSSSSFENKLKLRGISTRSKATWRLSPCRLMATSLLWLWPERRNHRPLTTIRARNRRPRLSVHRAAQHSAAIDHHRRHRLLIVTWHQLPLRHGPLAISSRLKALPDDPPFRPVSFPFRAIRWGQI